MFAVAWADDHTRCMLIEWRLVHNWPLRPEAPFPADVALAGATTQERNRTGSSQAEKHWLRVRALNYQAEKHYLKVPAVFRPYQQQRRSFGHVPEQDTVAQRETLGEHWVEKH